MSQPFPARLPLVRQDVDRNAGVRADPGLIDRLRADPATRVLPIARGRALAAEQVDGSAPRLDLLPPDAIPTAETWIYLGLSTSVSSVEAPGTPLLAAVLTDAAASALQSEELRWAGLRSIAAHLDDRDAGLFTEAIAVANWHDSHRFCPRCGTATDTVQAGWVRLCPVDNVEVFPRTDPAVIVRITDDADRILLGSNALWEPNRYSLLAGFVEPGESFEAAVLRETHEESGLRVANPVYLGSQPWPFPASIMVGFGATLADDEAPHAVVPDGEEILELRWFSREQLREAFAEILLPGPSSIAHAIVADWYGSPLESAQDG
ncbi:NAD(+) diphosphatase [Luethyella okanaganae]|uniref:NAD(+) diphosphatase n=1 Tax=Luethyella okanaganae TaxID=69372 RepID=A0ABW1VAS6_9MICO